MVNSSRGPVVGVDLGGTSVKAALVSADLELLARDSAPTHISDEDHLLTEIEQLVRRTAGDSPITAVGFGLPSQIDQRRGVVADSINVPITDVPFALDMTRRLGLPVKLDNDANVACLAEARDRCREGRDHVIMLTLGTGVGGGIVLDRRLYHGSTGYGGELGHMVIDENGPPARAIARTTAASRASPRPPGSGRGGADRRAAARRHARQAVASDEPLGSAS